MTNLFKLISAVLLNDLLNNIFYNQICEHIHREFFMNLN